MIPTPWWSFLSNSVSLKVRPIEHRWWLSQLVVHNRPSPNSVTSNKRHLGSLYGSSGQLWWSGPLLGLAHVPAVSGQVGRVLAGLGWLHLLWLSSTWFLIPLQASLALLIWDSRGVQGNEWKQGLLRPRLRAKKLSFLPLLLAKASHKTSLNSKVDRLYFLMEGTKKSCSKSLGQKEV